MGSRRNALLSEVVAFKPRSKSQNRESHADRGGTCGISVTWGLSSWPRPVLLAALQGCTRHRLTQSKLGTAAPLPSSSRAGRVWVWESGK